MRPIEHLPMPAPRDYDPSEKMPLFFYHNFVKHFVPDMIRMMDTGLHTDPVDVEDLRKTINSVLKSVSDRLEANMLIKAYQNSRLPEAQKKHAEKATEALRTIDYYTKPYKLGDIVHRTWVVNAHLWRIGRALDHKEKWTVKDLKQYNIFLNDPFFKAILAKRELRKNGRVKKAMVALAEYKLELWNRPRIEKAETPVDLEVFNPGSSKQNKEFFLFL